MQNLNNIFQLKLDSLRDTNQKSEINEPQRQRKKCWHKDLFKKGLQADNWNPAKILFQLYF